MTPLLPQVVFRVTRIDYANSAKQALSGVGGIHFDGRWHSKGSKVLYTSQSSTLCLLERIVHADEWIAERHPDRVMLTIKVPSVSYTYYTQEELASYDPNWQIEGNPFCRTLGNNWLAGLSSCALMVPSAANPMEFNVLFNPQHASFSEIVAANAAIDISPVKLDERVVSMVRTRRASL